MAQTRFSPRHHYHFDEPDFAFVWQLITGDPTPESVDQLLGDLELLETLDYVWFYLAQNLLWVNPAARQRTRFSRWLEELFDIIRVDDNADIWAFHRATMQLRALGHRLGIDGRPLDRAVRETWDFIGDSEPLFDHFEQALELVDEIVDRAKVMSARTTDAAERERGTRALTPEQLWPHTPSRGAKEAVRAVHQLARLYASLGVKPNVSKLCRFVQPNSWKQLRTDVDRDKQKAGREQSVARAAKRNNGLIR